MEGPTETRFQQEDVNYHYLYIFQKYSLQVLVLARRVTRPSKTAASVSFSEETTVRFW